MSYLDYAFDGTASKGENLITNETKLVDLAVTRGVFPEHGAFYSDIDGFVLEGRIGTGEWFSLQPEADFQYSPLFLQAAAMTGKQVFSYFVIIKNCTEVRYTYRAMGGHEDTCLMASLAQSNIDRSEIFEWDTIWSPSEAYSPRFRDPTLRDKTTLEVFNDSIEKILVAIANPLSSSVLTTADVTKLQSQLSGLASKEDLENSSNAPSAEPVQLLPNTPDVVLNLGTEVVSASFLITFVADDGRVQSLHVLTARNGDIPDQTIYGEIQSDDDMITTSTSVTVGQTIVSVTANTPGIVTTKLLFTV